MVRNRRHNGDRIDLRARYDIRRIRRDRHRGICLPYALQRFGIQIANGRNCRVVGIIEITDNIWTPIPVTDDTNFQCGGGFVTVHNFILD